MKNLICLLVTFIFTTAFTTVGNVKAAVYIGPHYNVQHAEIWKHLSAKELVKLSAKDFSKITGKKMTLKEKVSFIIMKKNLKKELKKNPDILMSDYLTEKKHIGIGWIIVGILIIASIILVITNPLVSI